MQYFGGKTRIAKKIATIMNERRGFRSFWDPFCGGLSVSVALGGRGLISDSHKALISLYRAVANGWIPPHRLTEEQYRSAKLLDDSNPLKAFAGYACSFGGKWFGGYARGEELREPQRSRRIQKYGYADWQYAEIASKSLVKDIQTLKSRGCDFRVYDFLTVVPSFLNAVIYLDPPYRNRVSGYHSNFDHMRFDERVMEWAQMGNTIFVSEYDFPFGDCVWTAPPTTEGMTPGKRFERPLEKLFMVTK